MWAPLNFKIYYQRIVPLKAIRKGGLYGAEIKQFAQNIIYCNFKGHNALFN